MVHLAPPTLRSLERVLAGLVLASAVTGCNRGPRLPQELTFEGRRLEKATAWSRGKGLGSGARPFAALHVCRAAPGASACAEADERLGDELVGRCLNGAGDCWDELCTQMWASRRAALEAGCSAFSDRGEGGCWPGGR